MLDNLAKAGLIYSAFNERKFLLDCEAVTIRIKIARPMKMVHGNAVFKKLN